MVRKEGKENKGRYNRLLSVGGIDYGERGDLAWKEKKETEFSQPFGSENGLSTNLLAGGDAKRSFSEYWGPLQATHGEAETIADIHKISFKERSKRLIAVTSRW